MKKETIQLVLKGRMKNTIVVGPMEVLDVKDSVDGVRAVMKDGVHLTEEAVDRLMDYVVCKVEELYTARKCGPTGRGETASKRAGPLASVGG